MRHINEVYDLLVHGENELALSKMDMLNSESIEYKLLKSIYFEQNGDYMKSANLMDEVIRLCKQHDNTDLLFIGLVSKLFVLYRLCLFKETKPVIEEIRKLIDTIPTNESSNLWKGNYFNYLGKISLKKGNLQDAFNCFEKSLQYSRETENKTLIGDIYTNIGVVLFYRGDLIKSLSNYLLANQYFLETNNMKGISKTNFHRGVIHYQLGEYNKSIDLLNANLKWTMNTGNMDYLSTIYFYLVLTYLQLDNLQLANDSLEKLEEIKFAHNYRRVELIYNVAKALYLKKHKRIIYKARAQEMLREVVETEVIDFNITVIATINLADLLLDEVRALNSQEAYEELLKIISYLLSTAEKENNRSLLIDTLLFRSEFALINGDLDSFNIYTEMAKNIAAKNDMHHYLEKINNYVEEVENQIDKWMKVVTSGVSLRKRITSSRIIDYLSDISHIITNKRENN